MARVAAEAGADYLGLVCWPKSIRALTPSRARQVALAAPALPCVGVFVDPTLDEIEQFLSRARIDLIQLHGRETPEFCDVVRKTFERPVIKAIRVRGRETFPDIRAYEDTELAGILLDTYRDGVPGGTGETFPWDAVPSTRHRVFLAGGLTAENVRAACERVRPFAVDVSSGVESAPGYKSARLIREFCRRLGRGASLPRTLPDSPSRGGTGTTRDRRKA